MRTNLRIALRFLLAKRRAMFMSLAGIVFGVGFIVLTQAITTGFQTFFIQTILGTDGAIRVEDKFQASVVGVPVDDGKSGAGKLRIDVESDRRYQPGIDEPRLIAEAIRRIPSVTGMSEVIRGTVSVQSATREESAQVTGIRLEDHIAVSDLEKQIVLGSLSDFAQTPSGILMGSALAERLRTSVGGSVIITYAGQSTRYRIAAIYETGVREIDQVRIFMHLGEARTLLKRPFGATFIQVGLADPDRAPLVAQQIERIVSHRAISWQDRERVWLDVFRFFRISAAITVSTIIVVSGLGMFNTLAMIVMEKTKEIAILRSMGYTRADIAAIFMLQGIVVLTVGVAVGCAVGALSTWAAASVPIRVRGIFSTDHLVVAWQFSHYWGAALAAAVVVMIASWLPAQRAARLEPGDVIRGTAQ